MNLNEERDTSLNRENNNNRSNNRDQNRDQRDRDRNQRPTPTPSPRPQPMPGPEPRPQPMPGPGPRPQPMPPNFPPFPPGGDGMPTTPPPNFVPEAPRMERSPMGGVYFVNPSNQQNRYNRPIRRCLNSFTYIWLRNGNNFWFYITRIDDRFIQGFRWTGRDWTFDRISRNRVIFYRCF